MENYFVRKLMKYILAENGVWIWYSLLVFIQSISDVSSLLVLLMQKLKGGFAAWQRVKQLNEMDKTYVEDDWLWSKFNCILNSWVSRVSTPLPSSGMIAVRCLYFRFQQRWFVLFSHFSYFFVLSLALNWAKKINFNINIKIVWSYYEFIWHNNNEKKNHPAIFKYMLNGWSFSLKMTKRYIEWANGVGRGVI